MTNRDAHRNHEDDRARLVELLLQKIAEDAYPSGTMMDFVEGLLRPDEVTIYAAVLMDKVNGDTYPSVSIMRRLAALLEPA